MSQSRRTQVRDLGALQLSAAPIPRDTYVQPGRVPQDTNTDNLVHALGFFNQNLGQMAQGMAVQRREEEQRLAQLQANQISLSTEEERAEIVRTGMIGGEPLANLQTKKMAGSASGSGWLAQIQQDLAASDLTDMDVEAAIHQRAAEFMQGVNDDPYITGGFAPYVSRAVEWAKSHQASQGLQDRERLTRNTSFAYLQSQVAERIEAGAEPEEVHDWLRSFHREIGVGSDRIMTDDLFDNHVMRLAQGLVEAHPEYAVALVVSDREGADGASLGSLSSLPQHTGHVANIINRGRKVLQDRETSEAVHGQRQYNLQRVLAGDYGAFEDFTVNGHTVSKSQQETEFLRDMTAGLDAGIAEGEITDHQKRRQIATYASRMNLDDPFIKAELDGIERRYNPIDVANNPEVLSDLEARAAWYLDYRNQNPQFIMSQVSADTREFFEAFDGYKRFMDPSTEGALLHAHNVVKADPALRQNLNRYRDEFDARVRQRTSSWFSSDSDTYLGLHQSAVQSIAERHIANGMRVDAAIDLALERVQRELVTFEGDPLLGIEGSNPPQDLQEILQGFVEDYRTMDARGKTFDGTATFVHTGNGTLVMRDREKGTTLLDENGKAIWVDLPHIREVSERRRKEREEQAVTDAVSANGRYQRRRAAARRLATDPGGFLTKEVLEPAGNALRENVVPGLDTVREWVREEVLRGRPGRARN